MSALTVMPIERPTQITENLKGVLSALKTAAKLPQLYEAALRCLREGVEEVQAGTIFLWEPSSGLLRPQAVIGYDASIFRDLALSAGESLAGRVFEDGSLQVCNSRESAGKVMREMRAANRALRSRSLGGDRTPTCAIAAPIAMGENTFGVIALESFEDENVFSEQKAAFVQAITDLVALGVERARLAARAESYRLDRTMQRLQVEIYETISHQLGMPLTAIKGYATALLLDDVEWSLEKRQEFLQLIEDECDQMEAQLASLLNSTLVDLSQLTFDLHVLRLASVAQEAVAEMERRSDKHQLIVDFPADFPTVQADRHWILQVFRNLLDNAIKYSPQGGLVVVRAEARRSDVLISISDQGSGILPENLVSLFDKYVRAVQPEGTQIPGMGLGLPIARMIVEAHGGHIWAQSRTGQGTTVSFTLPRQDVSTENGGS